MTIEEQYEEALIEIDTLKSELNEAVEVAYRHGAVEWVCENWHIKYLKLVEKFEV